MKMLGVQANKKLLGNRQLLASLVILTCIFLIYFGGTVCHVEPQFSFQPHHPRALVEVRAIKGLSQNVTTNSVIVADLDKSVPKLSDQSALKSPFFCAIFQFNSTTISSIGARAPPVLTL